MSSSSCGQPLPPSFMDLVELKLREEGKCIHDEGSLQLDAVSLAHGFTSKDAEFLQEMSQMNSMSLRMCRIKKMDNFVVPKELVSLAMVDNRIKGGLEVLSTNKNSKLVQLNLAGNPIDSIDALKPLKKLKHLKSLDLTLTPLMEADSSSNTEGNRTAILKMLPKLKVLNGLDRDSRDVVDRGENRYDADEGMADDLEAEPMDGGEGGEGGGNGEGDGGNGQQGGQDQQQQGQGQQQQDGGGDGGAGGGGASGGDGGDGGHGGDGGGDGDDNEGDGDGDEEDEDGDDGDRVDLKAFYEGQIPDDEEDEDEFQPGDDEADEDLPDDIDDEEDEQEEDGGGDKDGDTAGRGVKRAAEGADEDGEDRPAKAAKCE
ncbi:unnamed protein product [Vitrella brassicaformis CCMP3155]|uniref:U2A'/phosphoprotein 32 family A C-terminal domain-containing protein n=2 Tax=Vitrella brassicaformis TaxID=1169539 RepID=A0A0G4FEC8_VITBC|nr:unnamed protein product [Vitrella brassicaformis CCMP3155]|mmetsp:Transcript_47880/g.119779  ORF Transcript_47880/g.119779 Transcript_47880/m.119779 type:complete len:372 (+) Transcript_47880:96-1211(+)|eukprot:CEM11205.1 unnamed protein product [Vitrella brassicaformis CCMP3155]